MPFSPSRETKSDALELSRVRIVALPADEVGYGITVKRSPDQGLENENIQCAAKEF